jgi:Skp family chaperone for outer membrane proteins
MKRISFLLVLLLLSVASVSFAWADEVKPLKIAVVDLTRVFKEYKKTQTMESQLESLSKTKQGERERLVSQIKEMKDELALMSEEARNQKREAFEEKLKGLSQFDQETKEKLLTQREQSLDGLLKEIEDAVSAYSKKNGYDLVLSDRAILYRVDGTDISNEVISILNGQKSA